MLRSKYGELDQDALIVKLLVEEFSFTTVEVDDLPALRTQPRDKDKVYILGETHFGQKPPSACVELTNLKPKVKRQQNETGSVLLDESLVEGGLCATRYVYVKSRNYLVCKVSGGEIVSYVTWNIVHGTTGGRRRQRCVFGADPKPGFFSVNACLFFSKHTFQTPRSRSSRSIHPHGTKDGRATARPRK